MLMKLSLILVVGFSMALVSACGDKKLQTGTFIDSAVDNIAYRTDTISGRTDSGGNFNYRKGETIEFFINDLSFGSTFVDDRLSPIDLTENGSIDTAEVINKAVILQSLDSDNDTSNGIQIPEIAFSTSGTAIDFNQTTEAFTNDANALAYIQAAKSDGTAVLVTAEVAKAHLAESVGANSTEEVAEVSVTASAIIVTSGDEVVLTGTVNSLVNNYRWSVEDNSGITLTLGSESDELTAFQASFTAPTVTETTSYTFQFIGEDASEDEYTATVIIQVNPI